ncbi:hypothetical protein [Spirillospora sp. NBC_01491]|uniref:hypothetical protein n=1 Tax=Spirillospora sp. NBC_01491 TaxID=2976007 RepID=UPI002E3387E7|nr:hypothetical protein [Spirillospora sp. NBC_01491]
MLIIMIGMFALVGVAGLVYLADFARSSRTDSLFLPASSRSARRARRLTGMYIRGTDLQQTPDTDDRMRGIGGTPGTGDRTQRGGDQLVGR